MSLFPWARFRKRKSAVKLHTMVDLQGSIPAFIAITEGKVHDVNALDWIAFEAGAFYVMDRGYVDFDRLVSLLDAESGKLLVFVTNNFEIDALVVAKIYKARWQIELFFKWIKQNLRVKAFYGLSENAVKTQIWTAVSAYLMIAILNKTLGIEQSMSRILQVISVNIFSKDPLHQLLIKFDTSDLDIDNPNQLIFNDL